MFPKQLPFGQHSPLQPDVPGLQQTRLSCGSRQVWPSSQQSGQSPRILREPPQATGQHFEPYRAALKQSPASLAQSPVPTTPHTIGPTRGTMLQVLSAVAIAALSHSYAAVAHLPISAMQAGGSAMMIRALPPRPRLADWQALAWPLAFRKRACTAGRRAGST